MSIESVGGGGGEEAVKWTRGGDKKKMKTKDEEVVSVIKLGLKEKEKTHTLSHTLITPVMPVLSVVSIEILVR